MHNKGIETSPSSIKRSFRVIILPDLYIPSRIRRMGKKRNAYRLAVRKPEGKRLLGRLRRRRVDNKMDLREVGWGDVDWIDLAQNSVLNLRVP
jgi:hypothetical protein